MKPLDYILLSVYLLIMVAATVAMFAARKSTLGGDQQQMIKEYSVWVEEAKRQSEEEGPVKRRPPRGDEPPRIVLLRDYFGVCLGTIWVLGTGTMGTILLLLRGVIRGNSRPLGERGESE